MKHHQSITSKCRIVLSILFTLHCSLFATEALAQRRPVRYNCLQPGPEADTPADASLHRAAPRKLTLQTNWDASRTYPVAVLLVSYSDLDFTTGDPTVAATLGDISDVNERYQRLFNEQGFNRGRGKGCVREYFEEQSGGLFHPQFDIYGPVQISAKSTSDQRGTSSFRKALEQLNSTADLDFSKYDWDGDGTAESLIVVYAGYGGNESDIPDNKYCWPNTGSFSTLLVGSTKVSRFSASAERWNNDYSCGIGTICHEYSHALGLPDIYPTNDDADEYSVCDEWDLMDGGNFTNNGWCPPHYSAHEKMLLGWLTPEELTAAATITGMKSVSDSGKVYRISTDNPDEFFLLENRQWSGWDLRTPGHGLLISHIDYRASAWSGNRVNNDPKHHRYDLVHADGRNYDEWEVFLDTLPVKVGGHSQLLSGTPYPYVTDSTVNNALTDSTTPAFTIYSGNGMLLKPITNIAEDENGCISFHFMGGTASGISELRNREAAADDTLYDLQGRPVGRRYHGLVIRRGKLYRQ